MDKERERKKQKLYEWGNLGSRRDSVTNQKVFDVWGLTANILHDLAEIVYRGNKGREIGEEELIWSIWHFGGQMRAKERYEVEARLILSVPGDGVSFGEILPRSEFNRLKPLYKM
ncbi:hypothetical protein METBISCDRAFT_28809 [Metschnikowia bicuspidata]|uniref:Uncharacterized protein n=1 Tax=Metschnikowia bicuspidata TaxID=27322 RepID=A0A4P9Z8C7_9ASCO|nr:hypothetical protein METBISCDRAFT_28809 [Metschnikowia bicuspidata]